MMSNPMNEWRARGVTISAIAFSRSTIYGRFFSEEESSALLLAYLNHNLILGCIIGFTRILVYFYSRTGIDPFCSQCNHCKKVLNEIPELLRMEKLQRRAMNYYSLENNWKTTGVMRKLSPLISLVQDEYVREYVTPVSPAPSSIVVILTRIFMLF